MSNTKKIDIMVNGTSWIVDLENFEQTKPKLYPKLYLPRNPVRFIHVPGTMQYVPGAEKIGNSFEQPARFTRLRLAHDNGPGEIMTPEEEGDWIILLVSSFHESLPMAIGGYDVGLQSGGRSALRFLPDGKLLRIKGAEYCSQLELFEDVPHGSSIEFYVQREIKNYTLLRQCAPEELFAYTPIGWYDYGTEYRGEKVQAGLFLVKGDTRLDEILFLLAGAEGLIADAGLPDKRTSKFYRYFDEACFVLGRIAGIRLKQLDQTGIPWSRRTGNSNAHIGNMVVYDQNGETTIGIVDFDAAGGFMKSTKRKKEVISTQYAKILQDINEPVSLSSATDSSIHNQFYPRKGYSAAAQGFVEGYHQGVSETMHTSDLLEVLATARSVHNLINIERERIMYGIRKRTHLMNTETHEYLQWLREKKDLREAEGLFPKYTCRKKAEIPQLL